MKFHTTIKQSEQTATGIPIPDAVIEALGAGRSRRSSSQSTGTPTEAR